MTETEIEIGIIMEYTGWPRDIALAAISRWRKGDPTWNAQYVRRYLPRRLTSVPADSPTLASANGSGRHGGG